VSEEDLDGVGRDLGHAINEGSNEQSLRRVDGITDDTSGVESVCRNEALTENLVER